MAKTLMTVYVERDTMLKFKEYAGKGKVSAEIEALMNHVIQSRSGQISWSDLEEMKKEKESLRTRLEQDAIRLREIELKEAAITEDIAQKEAEKKAEEQAKEDKLKRCLICKQHTEEGRKYKTHDGDICRSCYAGLTPELLKKYL